MKRHAARLLAAVAALLAGALPPAAASGVQSVAGFYAGRRIDLYVGYSVGGGYDAYARLLARHLGRHVPGDPAIVVRNMPGAGSLTLANHLYNVAPRDGTAIGTFSRGLAVEKLLGGTGVQFDARRFTWLGSLNSEVSVCVSWHTSPVRRIEDLATRELIVGGTGSGANSVIFPLVLRNLLGLRIRLVRGYPGGNEVLLAMERGEVDGRCGWSWSTVVATRPDWVAEHKIHILLQTGLEASRDLPEVPLVMDLARSDDERRALELVFARQVMGRPFAAPPEIPAARRAALRSAFDATSRDPAFLADAAAEHLEINPVTGERVDALIARMYRAGPTAIGLATDAIRGNRD